MANKVSFIIELQDRFSRAGKSINKQIKKLGKNAARAGKAIKKLGSGFKRLAGLVAAAITAVGGFTIKVGADFQDSLADLSAITGSTGESLSKLTDETFRLAKAAAISQIEVAGAFTAIASAKSELLKDPKGLSVVTEQVLLLANAAGVSVPDAVRASVGALNQFSKGAEDASRFVNVIAAGSKIGASLVGETADALKNIGATAAEFGISFEEVNALIQVLAKSELKAAEAGTALKSTLSGLERFMEGQIAPSKIGLIKSLEILGKLGLSNVQIMKDFGLEALTAILVLRKNTPLVKQWTKELTGTNVAQEQADIRLATFNSKMKALGITIKGSMIKTFLRLEPLLTEQVVSLTAWLDSIGKTENIILMVDALKTLRDMFRELKSALGFIINPLIKVADLITSGIGSVFAGAASFLLEQPALFKKTPSRFGGVVGVPKTKAIDILNEAPRGKTLGRFGGLDTARQPGLNAVQQPDNKSTIVGEIIVRATQGTEIESTKLKTRSEGLNIGVNMIAEGA